MTIALLIYSFYKNIDSAALDEANRKLENTRRAMEDIIMQMPDAVCFCDMNGIAIMVNDPLLKVFGVDRASTVGKFNLFEHGKFLKCELGRKLSLLKEGETINIERAKVVLPVNRHLYISMKLFPTFSRDGEISGYMAIAEDITARVRSEEELKRAKELVELYIDLMGHDINNMNQIGIGYLEIAMSTLGLGADKNGLLVKPMEAMLNSSRLISNVKKLRRANEGETHLKPIDMNKILREVIAEYGQAPGKEVSIRYDGGNATVNANELLRDVFINLLSNAIKHSGGAVRIDIRQEAVEEGGRKCYRVLVEDDGPGIPENLKPVIFDRMLRRRAGLGGNGIGLYLVKTLVDSFGGSIAVEDRMPGGPGKGTRFIVTLPAA